MSNGQDAKDVGVVLDYVLENVDMDTVGPELGEAVNRLQASRKRAGNVDDDITDNDDAYGDPAEGFWPPELLAKPRSEGGPPDDSRPILFAGIHPLDEPGDPPRVLRPDPHCTVPGCGGHPMEFDPRFGLWLCESCGSSPQPPAMPPAKYIRAARAAVDMPRADLKYPENVERLEQGLRTMLAAYDVARMERERDRQLRS